METVKTRYLIVGGGLSGLMMAYCLAKRGEPFIIIEKNILPVDPKLHYIHEDIRGLLPFPLREVDVVTNILWDGELRTHATIDMMNHFSYVTTNTIFQNSSKFIDGSVKHAYIPFSGMESMRELLGSFIPAKTWLGWSLVKIDTGSAVVRSVDDSIEMATIEFSHVISTIPLPAMLKIAGQETGVVFETHPLKMTEVSLGKKVYDDLYQIIYIPKAEFGYSRISILGNRIVAEKANGEFEATEGENRMGLKKLLMVLLPNADFRSGIKFIDVENPFGRYVPIPEDARQDILSKLSSRGITCLGRYAEWTYRRFDHVARRADQIAELTKNLRGESL